MKFLLEYLKHPFTVGAWAPSSRFLAKKMMKPAKLRDCKVIVEYGPGTGVFTEEVLRWKNKDAEYFVIELNENFYEALHEKYKHHDHVHVIYGSAEETGKYLRQYGFDHADCIISGLPFASLPDEMSQDIFKETKKVLGKTGVFITFQYTLFKKKMFQKHFHIAEITKELRNFPPAYVFAMYGKSEAQA